MSSQEPSRSSKYDFVLDAFLIMLGSWKSVYNSIMTYYGSFYNKFDNKIDPTIQNSSQEPSKSSMYEFVLDALLIMLGS